MGIRTFFPCLVVTCPDTMWLSDTVEIEDRSNPGEVINADLYRCGKGHEMWAREEPEESATRRRWEAALQPLDLLRRERMRKALVEQAKQYIKQL